MMGQPQPAVPQYVRQHGFANCPAGHLFNLYFPVWNGNWSVDKQEGAKGKAVRQCLGLGSAAPALEALRRRQEALADALPKERSLIIDALSSAPFATGLGLEHPIENGFAFLSPYGLPYLAGSGVKGVMRRAAEELYGEGGPLVEDLFGPDDIAAPEGARRGALSFWDVFPEPRGGEMVVEIMTPHYSDYYQGKDTPHDAGKPNPIPFLAVPAGSKFRFVVTCEPSLLSGALDQDWRTIVGRIAEHAFDWLGFGAKTAVGYGALACDPEVEARRAAAQREAQERAARKAEEVRRKDLSADDLAWEDNRKLIESFRDAFHRARKETYKPGCPFDQKRIEFMKLALGWEEPRSRAAAGKLLRETMSKAWGMPSNKERKQQLNEAIATLGGDA